MSIGAAVHPVIGISAGVGIVLQFLRERADAARRLAEKDKGKDDSLLQDRARQLEVIIADIEAGLHLPPMVTAPLISDSALQSA